MKSATLLNSSISAAIASMGHTDSIVVADAGLPIPASTFRIDLALKAGIPTYIDTLETILTELCVEEAVMAEEAKLKNPSVVSRTKAAFDSYAAKTGRVIALRFVSHDELKRMSASAKAAVRTGECSPYANIILKSGVVF